MKSEISTGMQISAIKGLINETKDVCVYEDPFEKCTWLMCKLTKQCLKVPKNGDSTCVVEVHGRTHVPLKIKFYNEYAAFEKCLEWWNIPTINTRAKLDTEGHHESMA